MGFACSGEHNAVRQHTDRLGPLPRQLALRSRCGQPCCCDENRYAPPGSSTLQSIYFDNKDVLQIPAGLQTGGTFPGGHRLSHW